jgi:glycosyltransferase involved in cell wall biosynthesis
MNTTSISERPLVSIVMPTYNRLRFLPATVQSIFAQTFRDWELIVADDGSDEHVLEYLRNLERHDRVRVVRRPHSGNAGKMRNAAIAEARAPLVAFIDSDDVWVPTKLERQLAKMRAEPECRWSYTAFEIVDERDRPLPSERNRRWTPYSGHIFDAVVRGSASIRTPSVVVASTELVRDVGAFDEAIDCAEDYDLWTRMALRSPVCVVDEPLVRVRSHPDNSGRKIGSAYAARDYWLRKLAAQLAGRPRALLVEERSRNALAHARAIAAHGDRWRAVVTVARSVPLGWQYPRWWYGAAKLVARATLRAWPGARDVRQTQAPTTSADIGEARFERRTDEVSPGDR